ncbi:MAG: nucleotidyl transferase [Deltaproteobacteria bacterium]|nr:MAG: nucleotidyl transferase [Deltaproteobacteria bacterium]
MYAVIMAGGSGTRFWPASRKDVPKQFLNITGSDPMLLETCGRLSPLVSDDEMIIVLGKNHEQKARDLLKDRSVHILAEPVGRNTAPCIGLGALFAQYLGCDRAVAFLPADHFIRDQKAFLQGLRTAGEVAEKGGIVTLGIVPTRPETGYGYIRRVETTEGNKNNSVFRVSAFVEKPDFETAKKYLADGSYFWNAGIFVATPDTILTETKNCMPELYKGLQTLKGALGTNDFSGVLKEVYEGLESISFDYGVMEKTKGDVYVVPCECGWSDVGSWSSLYELRSSEYDSANNLVEGDALVMDCRNSFISSRNGRLVAVLGMERCLVVDTEDSLLVADLDRAQDIRKIVEALKESGKERLL